MKFNRLKELARKYPLAYAALYPALIARQPFMKLKWKWQEKVISNLSRLIVEDPIVRIDEFNGIFAMDSRSDLFSRVLINMEYEPRLVEVCMQCLDKSRDVIDVGANVGFYTVMFAKALHQGRVISVEPATNALKNLRKNITLNDVSKKVEIFEGVASDTIGELEITTVKGKEEYSSIGVMQHSLVSHLDQVTEIVASITLDELVKQKSINPGFIKVDVEGAENLVFKGAHHTLKEKRPIILSELTDSFLKARGSSAANVLALIRNYDYDIIDVGNTADQVRKNEFQHILCAPKEITIKQKLGLK
jgi:FkbM family methyltransferase